MKYFVCALAFCVPLCTSRAESQTFKTLLLFTGTGGTAIGASPRGRLTLSGTTLYGMTNGRDGLNGNGNIFSIGIDGTTYQNLVSFTGTSGTAVGAGPRGSLILSGTTLYGMTRIDGLGNVFSVGENGTSYKSLVHFTGPANGEYPWGSLTLSDTTLYGMTSGSDFNGNVFSVGTNGANFRNLLSFTGTAGAAAGEHPYGDLTLSGTTLYGMTEGDGAKVFGNVFSVGTDGTNYQALLTFTGTSGAATGRLPMGSLTLNGTTLYGMTNGGGAFSRGNIFSVGTDGSNYRNLLSFTGSGGSASGAFPDGSLILSGTTLYGMTSGGGAYTGGNIFSAGIDGSDYRDLYDFTGHADGGLPYSDLTLTGGTLFGTTSLGGFGNNGTIFALTLPTPEPGTLALVGAGAAALVSYRWQRRRR
jgi:hypothetical protein